MDLRRIKMWSRMNPNQKLKFAVVGNYHLAKGLSQFFEGELGMTPTIKLCSHSLKTVNEPDETIVYCEDETIKNSAIGIVGRYLYCCRRYFITCSKKKITINCVYLIRHPDLHL